MRQDQTEASTWLWNEMIYTTIGVDSDGTAVGRYTALGLSALQAMNQTPVISGTSKTDRARVAKYLRDFADSLDPQS